ncbi:hypothetical protein EY650_14170 [Enterococcus faecalis]|uniref:Uncharacterized protein n=3 Tax=Enterococcus faecalis TaxID=1351 RepID=E3WD59_ENTFL|nr:hypothetical protein CEQ02_15900 [Enterococcus faecalis]EEI10448.1 hypothetical protein HMPREF0348_3055 [Enterococcus faecalis TX0104]EEI55870.1 hypothetical protein HMPREF0346_3133 [Enterococcus faecalis EnGen0297]EEU69526.1 predicted protein [Enterococcus faecalis Merz96]EEU75603.1 predicted protein [Enterococcus faecalis JH1]EFE17156.1 hypothetical protein HMPREF9377_00721 [Enterococcus faecalis R712]EFE19234.1 hypothetical protein HMPREF9376_01760 [Enterococcus faecalis S613]EFM66190.
MAKKINLVSIFCSHEALEQIYILSYPYCLIKQYLFKRIEDIFGSFFIGEMTLLWRNRSRLK